METNVLETKAHVKETRHQIDGFKKQVISALEDIREKVVTHGRKARKSYDVLHQNKRRFIDINYSEILLLVLISNILWVSKRNPMKK